jgi:hypothetical protein
VKNNCYFCHFEVLVKKYEIENKTDLLVASNFRPPRKKSDQKTGCR